VLFGGRGKQDVGRMMWPVAHAAVSIDRISIERLPDNSPNSFGIAVGLGVGFNVVNEIIYTGELPRSSAVFDYYFLTGSLTVRNSSFKMAIDGVSKPTQNSVLDGIGANNTQNATIWNNTISGTAVDAIGLHGTSFSTVVRNKVGDLTLDPTYGLAQIYLDPTSSLNLLVCSSRDDTVIDKGTMNEVIGCEESTGSAQAAPAASTAHLAVTRPNPPRTKTPLDVQAVTK
jgi:hypothetical protein